MNTAKTIVAFGEVLWDILPTGAKLGGGPFNFIYRMNCLGDRGLVISSLGADDLGKSARDAIEKLGIETTYMQNNDKYSTGSVQVCFDENNQPSYEILFDVAYDHIELTDELLKVAGEADCVYFGTVAQRLADSRETLYQLLNAAPQAIKAIDLNLRAGCYNKRNIVQSLTLTDVVKLNEDEAEELSATLNLSGQNYRKVATQIVDSYSLKCCVITLGRYGALAVAADGETAYVPGYSVEVVDTVGSGDAFTAGFLHKYLQNSSLDECCEFANALGAMVAAQEGATKPLSEKDMIKFFISKPNRISIKGVMSD